MAHVRPSGKRRRLDIVRIMQLRSRAVGFRSTFHDRVAESTKHSREMIETAVAQPLKNEAEAAYQRDDLLARQQS